MSIEWEFLNKTGSITCWLSLSSVLTASQGKRGRGQPGRGRSSRMTPGALRGTCTLREFWYETREGDIVRVTPMNIITTCIPLTWSRAY